MLTVMLWFLSAALGQTAATAAPTEPPATFGIGPASAEGIDGRPYLGFLTSPGARALDHVSVENFATSPVTVNLYPADAQSTEAGAVSFTPASVRPVDAGSWMALPGGRLTLTIPGRQQIVVPVRVTVPADASPGDHAGAIVASLTSKVVSPTGQKVSLDQRIALRAYFRVSGPLHPALSVQQLTAHYAGVRSPVGRGAVTVRYRVVNTGNVRLGVRQHVEVIGMLGTAVGRTPAELQLLLPGASAQVIITIDDVLPAVRLVASVRLTPVVLAGDADGAVPREVAAQTSFWALPWTLLVALLGLVLLLWLARRRAGAPARRPVPPPPGLLPSTPPPVSEYHH